MSTMYSLPKTTYSSQIPFQTTRRRLRERSWFREAGSFKRVFGVESVVWGVYLLARAAIRLAALLHGSVEDFLLITIATGTPAMLVLTAWSIRYAIRKLSAPEGDTPSPTSQACA